MAKDVALRLKKCLQLRYQKQRNQAGSRKDDDDDDSHHVEPTEILAHNQFFSHRQHVETVSVGDDEARHSQVPYIQTHNVGLDDDSEDDNLPLALHFKLQTPCFSGHRCGKEGGYRANIATAKPLLEAYEKGAWWDVELLGLEKEKLLVHFLGYGDKEIEKEFLRYRTRRAYDDDCNYYLEPGMDVSVFSKHPHDSSMRSSPAWYDGKLISIHRKEHNPNCKCIFEFQFYQARETDLLRPPNMRSLVTGKMDHLNVEHLGILQKPFLKNMQTGTTFENVGERIWSIDSKMLPWPIFADITKLIKPVKNCEEMCVCEIKSKHSLTVGVPDTKLLRQQPPRTVNRSFAANTNNQRVRGVNIATHSEQAHEASLLEIAKIEPREMINRRQSSNKPLHLQRSGETVASSKDCGSNERNLINHRKATSKECCCFAQEGCKPQTWLSQAKIQNSERFTPVDYRQARREQRTDPGQYMHSFSAQGVKPLLQLDFKASHAQPEGEFAFFKARKKRLRKYSKTVTGDNRILLLSSLVDSIIQQKKRGWQRKVSILMSKQLSRSRLIEQFQLVLPKKSLNNSKALSGDRTLAICTKAPSKKRKLLRSKQDTARKHHKTETDVNQVVEDAEFSFNEFFKKAVENVNVKEAVASLDWSKLIPNKKSDQLIYGTQKIERKTPPKQSKETSKDMPSKRKRRRGPRDLSNSSQRKIQKFDESIELKDSNFSLHELLRKAKEDYEQPIPDWSRLPSRRISAHQIPWDPIIFHEDTENHSGNLDKEGSLVEYLWHDMELALARHNHNAEQKGEYDSTLEVNMMPCEGGHHFVLEEDEGLVCQVCGLVGCSIEAMLPPKVQRNSSTSPHREERFPEDDDVDLKTAEDPLHSDDDDDLACTLSSSDNQLCKDASEICLSVWDLIPELKDKMHAHQRDGFEFLWRSLAGSLGPCSMENSAKPDIGGCIISHAPGTGKSFLIISFLQSYMQLNPNCRPLILAPTIMLRPWQLEFKKWEVNVPIHILNTSRDSRRKRLYKDQEQTESFILASGSKISGRNLIDMHRMKAMSDWYKEDSILMMSYPLFARLTDDTNLRLPAVSRNIGQLLLRSPGLLVLDEGHLARNHESKLRKSLTRVQTRLRILLSGTIFQNNCCELFNTFHLVRPTFMRDVYHSQRGLKHETSGEHKSLGHSSQCDSVMGPRNAKQVAALRLLAQSRDTKVSNEDEDMELILDVGTEEEVEARARRLFMDKIGKTLENGQRKRGKVLEDAIKRLRSMTESFVHYYAGDVLKSLPGLKDYTVLLKTSPMQEALLHEIARTWDRGNSLDLEYIVSSVCIHPYLFNHVSGKESCTSVNLAAVGNLVKDPNEGVKVKFIMKLVQLCHVKNEKLLIFSQNVQPLHFLEELLQSDWKFLKGDRVLKLHGSLPLDDRQGIIDSFNDCSGNVRVLLASTKACGEGISLIGASRVVFLDMVWNPAVTKQAMSRAFRLGQRKEVFVYRLVASGSLEEDKYRRTIWKDWLSRSIFVSSINSENGDDKLENTASNKSTTLSKGLHSLTKSKGSQHGLNGTSFGDDTILSTILELEREDNSIVRIVKHDSCLDQGHMDESDSEETA